MTKNLNLDLWPAVAQQIIKVGTFCIFQSFRTSKNANESANDMLEGEFMLHLNKIRLG